MGKIEATPVPNLQNEINTFLERELRGGDDAVTGLAESLPERCRSCKNLARVVTAGSVEQARVIIQKVANECPVTHLEMGTVVTSCTIRQSEWSEHLRDLEYTGYGRAYRFDEE